MLTQEMPRLLAVQGFRIALWAASSFLLHFLLGLALHTHIPHTTTDPPQSHPPIHHNAQADRQSASQMPPPPWSYLALAGLRCLLVVLPGYIHPDEFFQGGQELFAPLLLGVHGCLVPWEFGPAHALRSVAFPCAMVVVLGPG